MMAAGPFRWVLTLLAMITPFAAATAKAPAARNPSSVQQDAADHVVFRHYL